MSAEILRRAASLMRERAEAATEGPWRFEPEGDSECGEPGCCSDYWENRIWGGGVVIAESHLTSGPDSTHIASWHPAVALAVAKAMGDVAHAWEIADESADGWVYDADDNHYRFDETVDGGWLAVARAYLGESA